MRLCVLPPPKTGLGLNHRVAALTSQTLQGVDQERADARGNVCVIVETDRVAILCCVGTTIVDLLKVCRKLGCW